MTRAEFAQRIGVGFLEAMSDEFRGLVLEAVDVDDSNTFAENFVASMTASLAARFATTEMFPPGTFEALRFLVAAKRAERSRS